MSYEIRQQTVDRQPIIYIEGTGAADHAPELMGKLLHKVTEALKDANVKVMPQPFTRFMSQKDNNLTMWVGFRLREAASVPGLEAGFLPGGTVLATEHIGKYDTLQEAHEAILSHIEKKGFKRNGEPWELYYTDPNHSEQRDTGRTVVIFPILEK